VTSNMVGPRTTPSKSKRKQLAISSEESDVEPSSGLKEILIEPEGIYQHTRIRTGTITLVIHNALAWEIEVNDEHSAIAESQSFNSYIENEAFVHMVNTPEEFARVQKEQFDMLQARQGSINDLKKILALFLDKKRKSPKKSRSRTSSSKSKGKEKEGENSYL